MKHKVFIALLFGCSVAPIIHLIWLIHCYGVDSPYWDEWETGKLILAVKSGAATFHDFFKQQNEHRQFFPNILFAVLAELSHWNEKWEMYFSVFLDVLSSLALFRLLRMTTRLPIYAALGISFVFNLILFNPLHCDAWLTGIALSDFVLDFCLAMSLLTLYLPISLQKKILICIMLSTISTFSFANGMNVWIVLSFALSILFWPELNKNRWLPAIWIGSFALNVWLYLHDYVKPPWHPPLSTVLHAKRQAIEFYCALFGSPFGFAFHENALTVSAVCGAGILGLFLLCCAWLARDAWRSRNFERIKCAAGWIALGQYALISGVMLTVGRLGFGVEQALTTRYMRFTLQLSLALLALLAIVAWNVKPRRTATCKWIVAGMAILLGAFSLYAIPAGIDEMACFRFYRKRGKAYLQFINTVPRTDVLSKIVFPIPEVLKTSANALDEIGYINPRLIRSVNVSELTDEKVQDTGSFDAPKLLEGKLALSGLAMLPYRHEPADLVLICCEQENGTREIIALVDVGTELRGTSDKRADFGSPGTWRCELSPGAIRGTRKLSAWAFDVFSQKAFKLAGEYKL